MRAGFHHRSIRRAAALAACALSVGGAALSVLAAGAGGSSSALNFGSTQLNFSSTSIAFPSQYIRTETAGTVEVTVPADVLFDFDKADIRAAAQPALQELAILLKEKARGAVTVTGHTDGIGEAAYNQKLSERRAAAVKAWLVGREGLGSMPITTSGAGARQPIAPNAKPDGSDNPDGRQLNRRVTVVFRK
jgi:outer membrane protein OmpA-like peptidoglycan-associated protein